MGCPYKVAMRLKPKLQRKRGIGRHRSGTKLQLRCCRVRLDTRQILAAHVSMFV